jgi:GPH family glycoside/pentoside/hexuronide:cation symporter
MSDLGVKAATDLRRDKVGIGFGSFGYNLGSAVLMTYLTAFLTDNMLIASASVAFILLISRIIDAFTDLWMGTIIDRCKSRMGKARPWILWMAAPAVASMALLFVCTPVQRNGQNIYAFITYTWSLLLSDCFGFADECLCFSLNNTRNQARAHDFASL